MGGVNVGLLRSQQSQIRFFQLENFGIVKFVKHNSFCSPTITIATRECMVFEICYYAFGEYESGLRTRRFKEQTSGVFDKESD